MNYQLNSYVTRKEAEALKEMIFRRARERSEAVIGDFQADVMSIARESFVSNNNPFSQILKTTTELENVKNKSVEVIEHQEEKPSSALHEYVEAAEEKSSHLGFPQKTLQTGAIHQSRVIQEEASAREIQNTMMEARDGLSSKKSFMGALSFLNSHAAVSLLNKRAGIGVDFVA